jgi:hypothetical protein
MELRNNSKPGYEVLRSIGTMRMMAFYCCDGCDVGTDEIFYGVLSCRFSFSRVSIQNPNTIEIRIARSYVAPHKEKRGATVDGTDSTVRSNY